MIFQELRLPGAYILEPELRRDHRGYFARVWCAQELSAQGLETRIAQCNLSVSDQRGALRGMHYQIGTQAEVKIVNCIRGSLYDVIIDLRAESPTYMQWFALQLTESDQRMLYVPAGFAHGFQTLMDNTAVHYMISAFHTPDAERGVRWNDPAFGIDWPIAEPILSARDRCFPDFDGVM